MAKLECSLAISRGVVPIEVASIPAGPTDHIVTCRAGVVRRMMKDQASGAAQGEPAVAQDVASQMAEALPEGYTVVGEPTTDEEGPPVLQAQDEQGHTVTIRREIDDEGNTIDSIFDQQGNLLDEKIVEEAAQQAAGQDQQGGGGPLGGVTDQVGQAAQAEQQQQTLQQTAQQRMELAQQQQRTFQQQAQEQQQSLQEQQQSFQQLTQEVLSTYSQLCHIPLSYAKEGLLSAQFPIEDYDELTVEEVSGRLGALSAEDLREVRDYEERNKNRETVLEQLDRKIRSGSS